MIQLLRVFQPFPPQVFKGPGVKDFEFNQDLQRSPAQERVQCSPLPDWVVHEPCRLAVAGSSNEAYTGNGLLRLLRETQVDLTGFEQASFQRATVKVLTRSGAEQVAHFTIEFDPAYDRVDIHFIRVLRNGECHEHSSHQAFQIFRRETNLERLALNGRLTASLPIPDVRVDDVVETGFTIYSHSRALGGKYSDWIAFDSHDPWLEVSHRLRRPSARTVHVKSFNGTPACDITESNNRQDSCWRIVGQPQREQEDLAPPWTVQVPALQFSEYKDWGEVARLFAPLYDAADLPASLTHELDRLATEYPAPRKLAAEWLRFVQRNLRYFAFSLGDGGWMPRELEAIWNSRFGDCKDAVRLYVAGARHFGLRADPALVSTKFGRALQTLLPSATVFDHCIVRLQLDGVSYWLDPTELPQCGDLPDIYQRHSGWGLPLATDACQLEELDGDQVIQFQEIEDVIEFGPSKTSPATVTRQMHYRSAAADGMRHRFDNEGTTGFSAESLSELQMTWPTAREVSPIVIHDDPAQNHLTTVLKYEILAPWEPVAKTRLLTFKIADSLVASQLGAFAKTDRTSDIDLGPPRKAAHHVRLMMPRNWKGQEWHESEETPGVRYSNRLACEGRTIRNDREIVVERHSIPASQSDDYNRIVAASHTNLLTIQADVRFGRIAPVIAWLFTLEFMFWISLIPVVIALGLAPALIRPYLEFDTADKHYRRGNEYHRNGQYQRAIQELSEAIRLEPGFADALDRRGVAYKNLGNYDRAIFDYDRAIDLNASIDTYYYNRGHAYYFKNQFDQAIRDYSDAIRLKPSAQSLISRGRCYFAITRFGDAIADYDEALRLEPRSELAYFNRATARVRLKEYEAAAADYDSALEIKNSSISLFGRGVAKRHRGDIAGGDADIAAAKALDPDVAREMAGLKIVP